MANVRIKDLPADGAPKQTDLIPIDLGSTRHATVKAVVESGRPTASKTEAEAGVDPQKAMTPLTTKQAIDAQVSAAYVPKTVKVNAGDGMTGGGELSGDVTVGLTVENVDRLTKVDGIEAGAQVNTVNSVNTKTGAVVLNAADVGAAPDTVITDINANTAARHTHSNKAILDATTASFLAAEKTKLTGIESGAQVNTVTSVAGKTGAVALAKADVGLGNVDNTSDASKPISTATQTALNAKANSSVTVSSGTGLTGGGNLTANRTVALNAASIASLGKADTALQAPGGTTGQILAKNSNTTNDVAWVTSEAATAVSYAAQTLTDAQKSQARANIDADKVYNTISDVQSSEINSSIMAIRTNGYSSAGDGGGALYKRVASEPTHAGKVQSSDGAWWELAELEINVLSLGARPDSTGIGVGMDNSPIFANAIDMAVKQGRNIYIPAGRYRLATRVTYDKSTINGDSTFVPSIRGDGVTMTRIYCDAGGIYLKGSLTAGFYTSWIKISDISLYGNGMTGTGLGVENQGFLRIERVKCSGFGYGAVLKGVISSKLEQPYLSYNNVGLYATPDDGDLCPPNALTVDQPWIASNDSAGIILNKPATFNIRGGSVEGNGTNTAIGVNLRAGIIINYPGLGGHAAIVSDGVYYEYNSGAADVLFFGTSREVASAFSGNTFTRMGDNPTDSCISVFGVTHKFSLSIDGNGFGELGSGATPSGPYINIENNPLVRISEGGNTYQNATYVPDFSGVMADCEQTRPIAMGYISAAGAVEGHSVNVASVTKVAAGQYKINLASPVAGRKFALTQPGSARITYNLSFDATSVTVGFTNLAGVDTDTEFGFIAYATERR